MIDQDQVVLKNNLKEVIVSKMEEFHMLGYDAVSEEDIWECATAKYKGEWPKPHQIVNDIYSLKPTAFMNWLTINAYKGKLT